MAINLESVLRRVMPLDWQAQVAVFAGRDLTSLDLSDPDVRPVLWAEQREVKKFPTDCAGGGYSITSIGIVLTVRNNYYDKSRRRFTR